MNTDYENLVHDIIFQITSQNDFQFAKNDEENIVEISRSNEIQKNIFFFF
jgi:hypothetical protein